MTHTNSTNGARNDTSTASIPRLTGWRHSATWTYLIMLIASAVALGASFILSAETLQLARHPESSLGCDVNAVVSCSTVAQSWQAELVKFGGLSYPNAFFGIAAEFHDFRLPGLGHRRTGHRRVQIAAERGLRMPSQLQSLSGQNERGPQRHCRGNQHDEICPSGTVTPSNQRSCLRQAKRRGVRGAG